MKKLSVIIATLMLMLSVAAMPALAATAKDSPELDGTVDVPVQGDMDDGKDDGKDVTSPDTSDSFTPAFVCLVAFDAALVAVYFLKFKNKAE